MTATDERAVQGSHPPHHCDLVMKGGITSGVVYPAAIARLHDTYGFANIGGASAGAIAAAATAAAEYGERRGAGGFATLAGISTELTEEGVLAGLFAPTRAARPAFHLLLRLQRDQSVAVKTLAALGGLAKRLWGYVLPAVLLALLLLAGLVNQFHPSGPPAGWAWVILGILLLFFGLLGLALGVVARTATLVKRHLPASFFGLCTGMPTDPDDTDPRSGLTPWLHAKFHELSSEPVLTFRHLRDDDPERRITLTVMTTDVSRARPVQLPHGLDGYCFRPSDMERLFPADVVAAMVEASSAVEGGGQPSDLRRLEDTADLPVLVATRMSLSFPVLLSAVPLYTVEHGTIRRHWFSDGGISSNFPIHLFDSWLPRRPTLALSFLPAQMQGDSAPVDPCASVPPVARHAATDSLFGFLSQILDTMQNWRDTLQSELPGFNDRVEVVPLEAGEGGINLTMPPDVIERLIAKGRAAGESLATFPEKWERHRFHRFRMTMRLLEQELGPSGSFRTASADALFDQLAADGWPAACTCGEQANPAWGGSAAAQARVLRELGGRWAGEAPDSPTVPPDPAVTFAGGDEPNPPSVMRRTPRV